MADKILVSTDLLEKCAIELKQAAAGFGDAASILAGLNTSEEWWTKMGRFVSFRLDDEGGTAEMGDAGAAVRALTSLMRRYDGRLTNLGESVGKAVAMFNDTEDGICAIANGQDAGEESNIKHSEGTSGFGGASGGGGQTEAGNEESKSRYYEETEWSPFGWRHTKEWENGKESGNSEIRIGGGKKDWVSASTTVTAVVIKTSADDKKEYDRYGKELAKDKNGDYVDNAVYTDKNGNPTNERNSAKRKGTLIEASKKVSADYSVFEANAEIENEKGSASASIHGIRVQGYAEGKGGIYIDELKHGDKKSYGAEIGVSAAIGVSATLLDASAEATYHTPVEGVDVHAKVDTKIGNASAGASAQVGIVDGKAALYAGASAEANLVEVGGEIGVNIGGVDATVGGEFVVGVGAHANAGYYDGVMKVDVGASVGIGAELSFEIDIGGAVENIQKNVDNIRKGAENIGKNIQRGVSRVLQLW